MKTRESKVEEFIVLFFVAVGDWERYCSDQKAAHLEGHTTTAEYRSRKIERWKELVSQYCDQEKFGYGKSSFSIVPRFDEQQVREVRFGKDRESYSEVDRRGG